MVKSEAEELKKILQELNENRFANMVAEKWADLAKLQKQTTLIVIGSVLITILVLNWWQRLTPETNGWILAALIGYLFGRGQS